MEIHDDPKIAQDDQVLLTNYVVLLNLTTDPVSMWVSIFAPFFPVQSFIESSEYKNSNADFDDIDSWFTITTLSCLMIWRVIVLFVLIGSETI